MARSTRSGGSLEAEARYDSDAEHSVTKASHIPLNPPETRRAYRRWIQSQDEVRETAARRQFTIGVYLRLRRWGLRRFELPVLAYSGECGCIECAYKRLYVRRQ